MNTRTLRLAADIAAALRDGPDIAEAALWFAKQVENLYPDDQHDAAVEHGAELLQEWRVDQRERAAAQAEYDRDCDESYAPGHRSAGGAE